MHFVDKKSSIIEHIWTNMMTLYEKKKPLPIKMEDKNAKHFGQTYDRQQVVENML